MGKGYVVVTENDGVFGVFNNPDVAHAWKTDNYPAADIYGVRDPNLPDLFLWGLTPR